MEELLTYLIRTGLLIFLWLAAMMDYKRKRLNFIFLCIGLTTGFVLQTFSGALALWELLAGVATGALVCVLAALSAQAVGYGDGFIISACGAWLGFYENIFLLLCSLLIMAVFGICILALKKAKLKDSLPFAPFLLAGYIAILCF